MRLPGFIDSHLHFLGMGYMSQNEDLTTYKSIKAMLMGLSKNLNKKIVIGRGWHQDMLAEKRLLTRTDLNQVSKTIPMVMIRACGHVLAVNDAMLKLAGIDEFTVIPEGGNVDLERGLFFEHALDLIYQSMPLPGKKELRNYFMKANLMLLEKGITSVASDDFNTFPIPYETIIDVINELYEENLIQVRITEQVNLSLEDFRDFIAKGYVNKRFGKLKMGPLKILLDGSLGGKTAALLDPYENDPDNYGIKTYTDEALFEKVHLADSSGMDVVIHAIGDAAVDQALNALTASLKITKRINHNHAIIHAQLATKAQINRMKIWNIGAIVQPIFLNSDIGIIEKMIGDRKTESYLFKTMYETGIRVGFSTDSPIESVNPFYNIYTAMKRSSIQEPTLEPHLPSEGFDLQSAIDCYTIANLPYIYEEEMPSGDYIEINRNLNEIDDEELLDMFIIETYINNELVYKRKLIL